jgi:hypothetical protein
LSPVFGSIPMKSSGMAISLVQWVAATCTTITRLTYTVKGAWRSEPGLVLQLSSDEHELTQ